MSIKAWQGILLFYLNCAERESVCKCVNVMYKRVCVYKCVVYVLCEYKDAEWTFVIDFNRAERVSGYD